MSQWTLYVAVCFAVSFNWEHKASVMLIWGGYRPIDLNLAGFVVSIATAKPSEISEDTHVCAGAIISRKIVLTAAHCVVNSRKSRTKAKEFVVILGSPNRLQRSHNLMTIMVDMVVPHESFARRAEYDIAILSLQQEIPEGSEYIRRISLNSEVIQFGIQCTTMGWGRLFPGGPYVAKIIYLDMEVLQNDYCRRRYSRFNGKGMICAMDKFGLGRAACRGDSGGPLVCGYQLYGIISWGNGCGRPGSPTIFTNVAFYSDWIEKVQAKLRPPK